MLLGILLVSHGNTVDTETSLDEDIGGVVGSLLVFGPAGYLLLSGAGLPAAETTASVACADGDCTNELNQVIDAAGRAVETACADGDCLNEVGAAARTANQGFGALSRAAEFGVQTYSRLRHMVEGTRLEAHHIIETRFTNLMGLSRYRMPMVAVTHAEHVEFTRQWRDLIPYVNSSSIVNTVTATSEPIWAAAQQIYANYPALLEAAYQVLFGTAGQ
jgi:hypothetical protein